MEIRRADEGQVAIHQLRAAARVEDPRVVLVRDAAVRFPGMCPNCGKPASRTDRVERAFCVDEPESEDSNSINVVDVFEVPFCDSCQAISSGQRERPSALTAFRRIFAEGEGAGGGIVAFVGLFFLKETVFKMSFILLIFSALPLLVGFWLMRQTYMKNRHIGVPKPTAVDLAVEFSPNLALSYEAGWRAFQFRSPEYAEAFRCLNEDSIWSFESGEARAAEVQRKESRFRTNVIVGTIVALLALWGIWDQFFR